MSEVDIKSIGWPRYAVVKLDEAGGVHVLSSEARPREADVRRKWKSLLAAFPERYAVVEVRLIGAKP